MTSFHSHYQLLHSTGEEAGIVTAFLQVRFKPAFKLPHYLPFGHTEKEIGKEAMLNCLHQEEAGGRERTYRDISYVSILFESFTKCFIIFKGGESLARDSLLLRYGNKV